MMNGKKNDHLKSKIHLVDPAFIEGVAQVLTYGAEKYGAYNWCEGLQYSRVYDALMRHALAVASGEHNDPETGLRHEYHIACNAMFLAAMKNNGRADLDDLSGQISTKLKRSETLTGTWENTVASEPLCPGVAKGVKR